MSLLAILAALKALVPTISMVGGGASAVLGLAGGFFAPYRKYLIAAAIVAGVVAVACVTVWIKDLEADRKQMQRLQSQEFQLSVKMKCLDGEEILPCWQRGQLEIAEDNAKVAAKLMTSAVEEQEKLSRDLAAAQADQSDAEAWRRANAADGKASLPPYVVGRYLNLRKRAGVK